MEAQITKAFELVSQPHNYAIKQGEEMLLHLKKKTDYPIVLLHYINNNLIGDVGKLRAAIQIKLWCKYYRDLQQYEQNSYHQIIESIKESIVIAYLNFPLKISKTLRPGIILLAEKFFPQNWPNLFVNLISYSLQYPNSTIAVLKLIENITHKYTYSSRSDPLYEEIIKVCDEIHDYLKDLTTNILQSVLNNPNEIPNVTILEILMNLFYNLNYQDLHPKYEDNLHHWMQVLKSIMKLQNTNQNIFKCKGAVLEVILLYATKYKEDVEQTIRDFCSEIWELCAGASQDPQYDDIVFNCLKFFKSLINWSQMKPFFKQYMDKLFQNLIISNISINQTSIALFEDQPDLYIDFYFRNSEIQTRRAAAIELLRVICRNYDSFEPFLLKQIQNFIAIPERNIKAECIILGLTIDGSSKGFRDVDGCTQLFVKPQIIHFCYQNIVKKSLSEIYNWLLENKNEDVLKNFNAIHIATLLRFLFYFRIFIPREELCSIVQILTTIKTDHKSLRKVIYLSINGFLIIKHGDFDTFKNLTPYFNSQTSKQIAIDIYRIIYEGTNKQQFLQESLTKMFLNITKALKESNSQFYRFEASIIKEMLKRTVKFDFSSAQFVFQTIGFIAYYLIKTNSSDRKDLENIVLDFFSTALKNKSDLLNFGMQILAIFMQLQSNFNQKYKMIYTALLLPQNWKEENQSIMSSYIQFIIAYLNYFKDNLIMDKPSIQIILSKIIQIDHVQLFYRFLEAIMLNTSLSQFYNSGYMSIFVQGAQALATTVQGKKAALIFMAKLLINYDVDALQHINSICQGFFDQLLEASSDILRTISMQKQRKYLFFSICKAMLNNCFYDLRVEGLVLDNLISNTVDRYSFKNVASVVQEAQQKEKKETTYKKLQVFKQFQKQQVDLSINEQQILVSTFKQVINKRSNIINEISQKNRQRMTRLYEKYNK